MSFENYKPEQHSVEKKEKYGSNVTLVIDLLRHPEKDYATGNLKEEGKQAFVDKLKEEYADPTKQFDTIKAYVSPMKRGQQAMEPLSAFLKDAGIQTTIRTKNELEGKMSMYTDETDAAMDKILEERNLLETPDGGYQKENAVEPVSKDEETIKNEILIQEFFDKDFPEGELKGEDVAHELDSLIQHFAQMAQRFESESKVKLVVVGHSGINEYLTKLIYLQNHPELKPEEVSVEQIGGLLDYMSGPKITIISDENGKQTAKFEYKDLSLEYALKSK
jgi:broad specificity phosphatase PhoE